MKKGNVKKIFVSLVAGAVISTMPAVSAQEKALYHTTSAMYVRPEKESPESLGIIASDTTVYGTVEGGWFRFIYQGKEAFVAARYVAEGAGEVKVVEPVRENPVETTVHTVTSPYVRPYPGATTSLGILDKNANITGYTQGPWFYFTYKGQSAAVAASFVVDGPYVEIVEPEIVNAHTTSSLYVRPYPGSSTSLGVIPAGTDIKGSFDGLWFRFTYKGQKAAIASAYVASGFAPAVDPVPEERMSGYTASSLYVRPNPGSTKSLGIIDKGVAVSGVVSGNWLRFTFNGDIGYIAKAFVTENKPQEPAPAPSPTPTTDPTRDEGREITGVDGTTTADLYIRPQPGSGKSLGILPKDSLVQGQKEGAWFRFIYKDQNAYIASAFIKFKEIVVVPSTPTEEPKPQPVEVEPKEAEPMHNLCEDGYYNVGITTNSVYIRPEPNSTKSLGILPSGYRIFGAKEGAWIRFTYGEVNGYVASDMVTYAPVIDISTHQKSYNIDYDELAANISGAILRVGYTGYGDGSSLYEDAQFQTHYDELSARGVPLGAYWYSCADTEEEGRQEAEKMIELMGSRGFAYPIYWDTEDPYHQKTAGPEKLTLAGKAFLSTLEKAGYYAGIYASSSWLKNQLQMDELSDYDVWVAHYDTSAPSYHGDYGMWQYTSKERLPGYEYNLDANEVYKDYPNIMKEYKLNNMQ